MVMYAWLVTDSSKFSTKLFINNNYFSIFLNEIEIKKRFSRKEELIVEFLPQLIIQQI